MEMFLGLVIYFFSKWRDLFVHVTWNISYVILIWASCKKYQMQKKKKKKIQTKNNWRTLKTIVHFYRQYSDTGGRHYASLTDGHIEAPTFGMKY